MAIGECIPLFPRLLERLTHVQTFQSNPPNADSIAE